MKKIIDWIRTHKGIASTGAFITILAIGLIYGFIKQMKGVEERTWETYYIASRLAFEGQSQEAHKLFEEIENQHSRKKSADFTLLINASLYVREGNWPAAIERYQKIITKAGSEKIVPIAIMGLSRTQEASGALDQALENYQRLISDYPDHFSLPQAYEGLARIYEMKGEFEKSKEQLERLRVLYPESIWSHHAELRLRNAHAR